MAFETHQFVELYVRVVVTDPVFGIVDTIFFSNREINGILETSARVTVQEFKSEEGISVTTAKPKGWRWDFTLSTDEPVTYEKLDKLYSYTLQRFSFSASLVLGLPVYSGNPEIGMQNVPGLGALPSMVIIFGDNVSQRDVKRGIGAPWQFGSPFTFVESVTYTLPGAPGGNGGGQ